jgi:hypothetical protein
MNSQHCPDTGGKRAFLNVNVAICQLLLIPEPASIMLRVLEGIVLETDIATSV